MLNIPPLFRPLLAAVSLATLATGAHASDLDPSDPAKLPPHPKDAAGYPSRDPMLDALPGFVKPPPGYGEVAFYWWIGEPLTKERLQWQLDQLKGHHISGLQINYMHADTAGWPSVPSDPPVFTPEWWTLCKWFMAEAKKDGMAVSLSDYTLGGPGQGQWNTQTITEHPEARGQVLENVEVKVQGGKPLELRPLESKPVAVGMLGGFGNAKSDAARRLAVIGATAYRIADGKVVADSAVDLRKQVSNGVLKWQAPAGSEWRVNLTISVLYPVSLDPMNPLTGAGLVKNLFEKFDKQCPGEAGKGLNFFFSDELTFGVRGYLWNDQFAREFQKRKGYDILPELAGLFTDIGPRTEKVRLDYSDVMVSLTESGYFVPAFRWHYDRGMVYGCDHGGRGHDVTEFGDYFRTQRWNTGPGNDSPKLGSDLIKNKVSSSMAHLYERERTWNEGYYSSGWGTTTADLADALYRNMSMGHNLLTLHGLYYTTYGGYWEWAPPCNHFRMPYWDHLKEHQAMSERLSYLMSQGVHRCDVAILYPVAAMEADGDLRRLNPPPKSSGRVSVATAFDAAKTLNEQGIDFDFMDFESLSRAKIGDRQLKVAGEQYRVLVIPGMQSLRFETLSKALDFQRAGGIVVALSVLPAASDRIGRDDAKLDSMVKELFGATARDAVPEKPAIVRSKAGGQGVWAQNPTAIAEVIDQTFPRDVAFAGKKGTQQYLLHRKIGPREVYMVYGAPKGSAYFFRTLGIPELWDPWTGKTRPLAVAKVTAEGTEIRMPLTETEAQLIVFNPGKPVAVLQSTDLEDATVVATSNGKLEVQGFAKTAGEKSAVVVANGRTVTLKAQVAEVTAPMALDGAWDFELVSTMDNRFGDFRLPASNTKIGAEARFFRYAEETAPNPGWEMPDFNDAAWPKVTTAFGQQFWKLGPLPENLPAAAEAALAALKQIDPKQPVMLGGKEYRWQPYAFSWRWGKEGDPGHQGFHGLKENITDEFLCLGSPEPGKNQTNYVKEAAGTRYYLWTSAAAAKATEATVDAGGLKPAALYLNGAMLESPSAALKLQAGSNPLLVRYDAPGRGHLVLLDMAAPKDGPAFPLSMSWFTKPGVIPFDVRPQETTPAAWYRFTAPPGLRGMRISALGKVRVWVNGKPIPANAVTNRPSQKGVAEFEVSLPQAEEGLVPVAVRVEQARSFYGGSALPEPIALDCGPGKMPLGDWAQTSALGCYSGGAWYRRTVAFNAAQTQGRVTLDLGNVSASAELRINGKPAGIRLAPPWTFDIGPLVKTGENRIEVLVYNALANHYLTIPTNYRGSTVSGLRGPVNVTTAAPVVLHE